MISGYKHYFPSCYEDSIAYVIDSQKYDNAAADKWNLAYEAITNKHGYFSPTDELCVAEFWFHVNQLVDLLCKMVKGEDVSNWREKTPGEYVGEILDGIREKSRGGEASMTKFEKFKENLTQDAFVDMMTLNCGGCPAYPCWLDPDDMPVDGTQCAEALEEWCNEND